MTVYKKGTTTMALIYSMRAERIEKVGNSRSNNRWFTMGHHIKNN